MMITSSRSIRLTARNFLSEQRTNPGNSITATDPCSRLKSCRRYNHQNLSRNDRKDDRGETFFKTTTILSTTQSAIYGLCRRNLPSNFLSLSKHSRSMFIQTETTPNPDAIKFIPGVKVMKNGTTKEFLSGDDTRSSPLARSLLSVPGVKSIFFGPDFISINKDPEENWSTTKPEIFSLLMEFFSSAGNHDILIDSQSSSSGGPIDTRINDDDDEVVGMIKELLDTRVRPAIQEDGGDLEYKGFDEQTGVVSLMLKGSCRGCDSSSVTLKNGIERMLMHYIPEVQSVEQVESEEEKVSKDEFEKFEARLRAGGKTVDI